MHNWIISIVTVLVAAFGGYLFLDDRFIDKNELANNQAIAIKVATSLKGDHDFLEKVKGPQGEPGESNNIPIGTILPFPGSLKSIPLGWWVCDGREIQVSDATELYKVIGVNWGGKKGVYFRLPNFQGRFLRGVDDNAKTDFDSKNRSALYAGGNKGDTVGTYQDSSTSLPKSNLIISNSGDHNHSHGSLQGSTNKAGNHSHVTTLPGRSGNNAFTNRKPAWGYDDWQGSQQSAGTNGAGNHSHIVTLLSG